MEASVIKNFYLYEKYEEKKIYVETKNCLTCHEKGDAVNIIRLFCPAYIIFYIFMYTYSYRKIKFVKTILYFQEI